MVKPPILLLTGPRGSSKSLIGELIYELGKNNNMVCMDSSAIINLHIERKTPIGIQLQPLMVLAKQGKLLPGELVFNAIQQWMSAIQTRQTVYGFILPGCSRSPEESRCWKSLKNQSVRQIHVGATEEQITTNVLERQKKTGIIRDDESPEAIAEAIKEYKEKIIPAVGVFNGMVAHTHRSKPMRIRLTETIEHMDLPKNIRRQMLNRLRTKSHPVCIRVNNLDGIANPHPRKRLFTLTVTLSQS